MSDVFAEDGLGMIALGDVLITVWQEPATLARWQRHAHALEALASSRREAILLLHLILPSSTPPGSSERSAMQKDLRRLGENVRKLVVVPVGNSLWMNLVRPIVRTVLLLSGHSKRHAVSDSVERGIAEIREARSAATPRELELRRAIGELCQALGVDASFAA